MQAIEDRGGGPSNRAPLVVLLSTYDLGRQPFGLASPLAWLRAAGIQARGIDLSRDRVPAGLIERAALVGVYLPMHTATRLALPILDEIRTRAPGARLVAYGLYAPLNAEQLRAHGVHDILGPEFEADLVALARRALGLAGNAAGEAAVPLRPAGREPREPEAADALPRLTFITPERGDLPPLSRYAPLRLPDGTTRLAGSTEATRGCKHRCRHCPIVPIYQGRFRVVPAEVVLADIARQVEAGAAHITFGDPDFLNGPAHACRIVEALHARWPSLTYDVTAKIEHLRREAALLPVLRDTGCAFVTSAVESLDDRVLAYLEKGHTRADVEAVAHRCREIGLPLVPTFLAFTPWTNLDDYLELLDTMDRLELVEHVAPVQWTLRLLVTWRSRLLELPDIRRLVGPFDPATLTYPWRHPDPRMDALHAEVMALAGVRDGRSRREVFAEIRARALAAAGREAPRPDDAARAARATVPYLEEPWYC